MIFFLEILIWFWIWINILLIWPPYVCTGKHWYHICSFMSIVSAFLCQFTLPVVDFDEKRSNDSLGHDFQVSNFQLFNSNFIFTTICCLQFVILLMMSASEHYKFDQCFNRATWCRLRLHGGRLCNQSSNHITWLLIILL